MEIFEEFGINPILLLAQIVNFTILLLLLKKFLYKPILKILEDRKKEIAASLKNAEEIEKRLEKTNIEQEKILEKARSQADNLLKEAKIEAKNLSEITLNNTKKTVEEMLKQSKERFNLERIQMMNEVKKDLAELVIAASLKVTQKAITKENSKKIVEQAIKEVIGK